jgi:hypothetical protein
MFVLSSLIYSDKCYAQTEPTSSDWVSFVFTCVDKPNDPYYDVVFPGGTFMNFDYNGFHTGIDFDPTPGPNWDISPSGDLMAFPNFFTDYRDFGYIDFVGQDGSGNDINARVYFVECCEDAPPTVDRIIAETSRISFWESSGNFLSETVLVLGTVDIDISIVINSSTFLFGTDARLDVIVNVDIDAIESEFIPFCNYRWDAITSFGPNKLIQLDNCIVNGAHRGIFIENNSELYVNQSVFDNNLVSILLENLDQSGQFGNDSRFYLSGSEINNTINYNTLPVHPQSTIDISGYLSLFGYSSQNGIGIMAVDLVYAEVGNQLYDVNMFFDGGVNEYTCLAASNSFFSVERNEFDHSTIIIVNSAPRFGGPNTAQRNWLYYTSSKYLGSSAHIQNNIFDNGFASNNTNGLDFFNSVSLTPPNANEGIYILDNTFYWAYVILDNSLLSANIDVRIRDENVFICSPVSLLNMSINPSTQKRVIINDNYMLNSDRPHVIMVNSSNGVAIGGNTFVNNNSFADLTQPLFYNNTGVRILDSEDVEIVDNKFDPQPGDPEFNGFKNAIYAEGALGDFVVQCNEMYNVFNGINFDNATLTSDIGEASSSGVGANNLFEEYSGFNGFNGSVTPNGSLVGNVTSSIDYYWDNGLGGSYDPSLYGGGNLVANITDLSNGGTGCLTYAARPLAKNNFEVDEEFLSVYPNPSTEVMTVKVNGNREIQQLKAVNNLGQTVWESEINPQRQVEISLPSGHYVLQSFFKDGAYSQNKIIFTK